MKRRKSLESSVGIPATEIKGITEFDQDTQRHEQTKDVLPTGVVNERFNRPNSTGGPLGNTPAASPQGIGQNGRSWHQPMGQELRQVRGWVCVTNANINRKHDERVFFRDGTGTPGPFPVTDEHRRLWRELIQNYQSIHVQNLSAVELGALLWLLDLQGDCFFRFDGGKPLGFGSARLEIESCDLRAGNELHARYGAWHETAPPNDPRAAAMNAFREAVVRAYRPTAGGFDGVVFIRSGGGFPTGRRGGLGPGHQPRR